MSPARALRIGTRGSPLALWQARTVANLLEAAHLRSELVIISTTGDRVPDAPLSESGGKRLFVRDIEEALLREEIDLAVHSAKDMAAVLPPGLVIAAALPREQPHDALVLHRQVRPAGFDDTAAYLGSAPRLGTSSVRRSAQLARLFPQGAFVPIRGNVDTRLRKLDTGGYDALVLACAGLRRLGLADRITAAVPIEHCVPAPGQGIVAIETRADDGGLREAVRLLHDERAGLCLTAERSLVRALGGGCQVPLGGLAVHDNGRLELHAVVASPDGRQVIRRTGRAGPLEADTLGRQLADELVHAGASRILDAVRRSPTGQ